MNSRTVRGFADTLSVAPKRLQMCRDDSDLVVFCFRKPQDAEAFAKRLGGERLPVTRR
jgi:hypothetical protein